jgi:type I restriction enzyme S subunit
MGSSNAPIWPRLRLDALAREITVGHVGSMANQYCVAGVPFLRSLNVQRLRLSLEDVKYIDTAFHSKLSKSRLRPGDVVIVRTGSPGTCAVIPPWLEDANCSDLVIVRPADALLPHYLAYFMNSLASDHVSAHTVGAVQQHFNVGSARELLIPLPPLPEQRAIAHILGTLDDKIELNRRTNETLEAMARALFKSWFVDFDPVHAKKAGRKPEGLDAETAALFPDDFEDSEMGKIPRGWRVTRVDALAEA